MDKDSVEKWQAARIRDSLYKHLNYLFRLRERPPLSCRLFTLLSFFLQTRCKPLKILALETPPTTAFSFPFGSFIGP